MEESRLSQQREPIFRISIKKDRRNVQHRKNTIYICEQNLYSLERKIEICIDGKLLNLLENRKNLIIIKKILKRISFIFFKENNNCPYKV